MVLVRSDSHWRQQQRVNQPANTERMSAPAIHVAGPAATRADEIDAIKALIVKAESDTHTWQVAEDAEKYMEAFDRSEALELQLDKELQASRAPSSLPDGAERRGALCTVAQLVGVTVFATDGPIGQVKGVLFDAKSWSIRCVVVKTGAWLSERDVFIPLAASRPALRREGSCMTIGVSRARQQYDGDPPAGLSLYSSTEVCGDELQAADASIGHVEDLLFDDEAWVIRSLVVNTRNWWPGGERVLVATYWIDHIDADKRTVHTRLTRDQVVGSPECRQALLSAHPSRGSA